MPGTIEDLLEFTKKQLDPEQSIVIRSAVRKVFYTVFGIGWRHQMVREIDIEQCMTEFSKMSTTDYSEHSLRSYKSRITTAIRLYKEFRERGIITSSDAESSVLAQQNFLAHPAAINSQMGSYSSRISINPVTAGYAIQPEPLNYPFPLSSGQVIRLHLPPRLTRKDADRLKTFIDTLVIESETKEGTE